MTCNNCPRCDVDILIDEDVQLDEVELEMVLCQTFRSTRCPKTWLGPGRTDTRGLQSFHNGAEGAD